MGNGTLKNLSKTVGTAISKNSPEIMLALGIAGLIGTAVMVGKATPKFMTKLEKRKKELNTNNLTTSETVKIAAKCYAPAAATAVVSTGMVIGAHYVDTKRNAALATAYTLAVSEAKEYQNKVIETIGEKKEQVVRDAIAKDKIDETPIAKNEVIITKNGDTLCFDPLSHRYFKSDIETIRKAVNDLNLNLRNEDTLCLNDYYTALGIEGTELGWNLGWDIQFGYIKLNYSSQLAVDGTPCLVLGHDNPPRYMDSWV